MHPLPRLRHHLGPAGTQIHLTQARADECSSRPARQQTESPGSPGRFTPLLPMMETAVCRPSWAMPARMVIFGEAPVSWSRPAPCGSRTEAATARQRQPPRRDPPSSDSAAAFYAVRAPSPCCRDASHAAQPGLIAGDLCGAVGNCMRVCGFMTDNRSVRRRH